MTARRGAVSIAELLLVFWLFGFVMLGVASVLAHHGRLASGQRDLTRYQEARRTVELVLGTELRWLAAQDLRLSEPEWLGLRAIRGGGPVCGSGDAWIDIRYEGARRPEPSKDSVLVVGRSGETLHAIAAVAAATACEAGGLRLGLDRVAAAGSGYALVFETGSYHAVDGALRYRLGAAGRQPLTETFFSAARIAATPPGHGIRLRLDLHADSLPRAPRASDIRIALIHEVREPPR